MKNKDNKRDFELVARLKEEEEITSEKHVTNFLRFSPHENAKPKKRSEKDVKLFG